MKKCIANVGRTKRKIVKFLERDGKEGATPTAIAEAVFQEPDPLRLGILILLVTCYLDTMEDEGTVVVGEEDEIVRLAR